MEGARRAVVQHQGYFISVLHSRDRPRKIIQDMKPVKIVVVVADVLAIITKKWDPRAETLQIYQ